MKSNRMFSILNLLINNQKLTAEELAEKLEVSKRTIYRDIESLSMAGIPVVSCFFSIDELQTILIGLDALNSISQKKNINTLITKISQTDNQTILDNADIVIDLSSWFLDHSFQEDINQFRKAINEQTLVMIEYHSNTGHSKRKVEPYKLVGVQKFQFDSYNNTISFKTNDKSWAIDFVISLKDKVKLIEPSFLVKDIKNTIEKMNLLYES